MSKLAVYTIVVRVPDDHQESTIYAIDTRDGYLNEVETYNLSALIKADDKEGVVTEWVS